MVINIIIALLAFFLAGAVPILQPGVVSFFIWCVILFLLAGFGWYHTHPENPRWFF